MSDIRTMWIFKHTSNKCQYKNYRCHNCGQIRRMQSQCRKPWKNNHKPGGKVHYVNNNNDNHSDSPEAGANLTLFNGNSSDKGSYEDYQVLK